MGRIKFLDLEKKADLGEAGMKKIKGGSLPLRPIQKLRRFPDSTSLFKDPIGITAVAGVRG